jgi:hypothetical protein
MRWLRASERIATGLRVLAHLDAFTDVRRLTVGFSLAGDEALAARYVDAIRDEHVDARTSSAGNEQPTGAPRFRLLSAAMRTIAGNLPADEVLVPCSPEATDEEITHVVLAVLKASHAIEFGDDLDTRALFVGEPAAQLQPSRALDGTAG